MLKKFLLLTITVLFLAACSTAGNTADSDVEPVFDEQPTTTEEETAVPNENPVTEPTENPELSSPSEVNLSDLTPTDNSGDLVVQPAPGVPDEEAKLLRQITVDLSEKIGVDVADIDVANVEPVVWNDSGLGCPQPDVAYLQVLTDGFRVTLNVNGLDYFYHTRGTDNFILCQQTMDQPITNPPAPDQ